MSSGRQRYSGLQTFVQEGCYFLCLCSVAEDSSGQRVDIVDAYNVAIQNNWATSDAFINNPLALLKWLTKREWKLRIDDVVPSNVQDNEYTVLKYKRGGYTHFRRRDVDTLLSSKTVKEGKLEKCYVFEEI